VQGASLKGNPEANTCLALADQILTDGFATAGDPLYVTCLEKDPTSPTFPGANQRDAICAGQIGYVKVGSQFMVLKSMGTQS
jgi:hypothetical protein